MQSGFLFIIFSGETFYYSGNTRRERERKSLPQSYKVRKVLCSRVGRFWNPDLLRAGALD